MIGIYTNYTNMYISASNYFDSAVNHHEMIMEMCRQILFDNKPAQIFEQDMKKEVEELKNIALFAENNAKLFSENQLEEIALLYDRAKDKYKYYFERR